MSDSWTISTVAPRAAAGLHHEQARLHQLVDQPLDLRGVLRQLAQLVERDDGAGALGGDQPQEDGARQRLAPGGGSSASTLSAWLASAPAMPPMAS